MSYRPPTKMPTSAWARFLHEQHRLRDWSATRGFEELREGLGLGPKSRTAYTDWLLSGRRDPNAAEAAFLREFFGGGPEDMASVSPPEPVDLQAATLALLTRQAEAAERQAAALEAQNVINARLADLLAQLVVHQADARDADAIFREEAMEALGQIAGSLAPARTPAEGSASRRGDAPHAPRGRG